VPIKLPPVVSLSREERSLVKQRERLITRGCISAKHQLDAAAARKIFQARFSRRADCVRTRPREKVAPRNRVDARRVGTSREQGSIRELARSLARASSMPAYLETSDAESVGRLVIRVQVPRPVRPLATRSPGENGN